MYGLPVNNQIFYFNQEQYFHTKDGVIKRPKDLKSGVVLAQHYVVDKVWKTLRNCKLYLIGILNSHWIYTEGEIEIYV